jgi:adenylate cyclase class 2
MNVEIEAKIKVENLDEFIVKLEQLGAEFQKKVVQKDTFFDEPEGRLLHDDCGLRLRAQSEGANSRGSLCFKGARQEGQYKRRREIEFEVGDIAEAQELLKALGFVCTMVVEKHRQVYRLHDCEVCLDRVSGLGDFIEIEGPGETAISRVQAELGLGDSEHIRDSYAILLAGKRT